MTLPLPDLARLAPTRRLRLALPCLALAASLLGCAAAPAQPTPTPYEPQRGQAGKDVIWIASPDSVVERMLQMGEVTAADHLVDLGSGDGKIVIAAARTRGTAAVGLEYNPKLVELSVQRAREAGVAGRTRFEQADIFVADFSAATVVTMYLLPELNLRLRPQLFAMKPGTRIVSHSWRMGDWQPDEVARLGTADVFLWRIPANVSGRWQVRGPAGAPQAIELTQRFQQVAGSASFGALAAGLADARLQGERLSFQLRDASGALQRVEARVTGARMAGTITPVAGAAGMAFEAVRAEPPPPIAGIAPTEQERMAAARALE